MNMSLSKSIFILFSSETSNISRSLENDESQISEEFITAKDIQNKSSRIKHPQIQRIANELKPSVS